MADHYHAGDIKMSFHDVQPEVTRLCGTHWLTVKSGQLSAVIFLSAEKMHQLIRDLIADVGEPPQPPVEITPTILEANAAPESPEEVL